MSDQPSKNDRGDNDAVAVLCEPVRRALYDFVSGRVEPVGRDEAATAVGIGRPYGYAAVLGAPVPITFTPHLVPLDQGELVSCYVTGAAELDDVHDMYVEAYADEPFVEVVSGPPGVRDVRETNLCRISVHRDERTGRVIVFSVIDNLWKGAASQAVQNLNLMFGYAEGEGLQ